MNERNEYPRPQFQREQWVNLNGKWDFDFDDKNVGLQNKWYSSKFFFPKEIVVPYAYQSKASKIDCKHTHETVWYGKSFKIDKKSNKCYILNFGAVDYEARVFLNGQYIGNHIGGNTSFSFDITNFLNSGDNRLILRVFDSKDDETILRGKQYWKEGSEGIWYTNSTGIWQTVWLEELPQVYLKKVKITPNFDQGKVQLGFNIFGDIKDAILKYDISYKGELVVKNSINLVTNFVTETVDLINLQIFRTNFHNEGWTWSPDSPNLFDVTIKVINNGSELDKVRSYFGFRKIHKENGMVYLNNKPFYQKLILDQGYWPESLLTAPSDEAYKTDIELAKKMGFNGCRKHQKTEDPRFLYWADKLGYVVWGECASAPIFNENSVNRLMTEWQEIIDRDYNHPAIITWVPLNESWGVPNIQRNREQQHFSQAIYHYIHSVDSSRLVVSNDGWSMTETDICAVHNYAHGNKNEQEKYQFFKESISSNENILSFPSTPWPIFANGFSYKNEPIMLTEFGGIGFKTGNRGGWGYSTADTEETFLAEYERVIDAVYASKAVWGFCYTQLTDIEQEINGLLNYDRNPKCSLDKIKAINDKYHQPTLKINIR